MVWPIGVRAFFKDSRNRHTADPGRAGNRTLRAAFERQLFDGGALVRAFLVKGIKRAIGIAVFTVEFLLTSCCTAVLGQISRAAAATSESDYGTAFAQVHPAC